MQQERDCSMCWESFKSLMKKNRTLITLKCRHTYCLKCLRRHVKTSVTRNWKHPTCGANNRVWPYGYCRQKISSKRCFTKKIFAIMKKKDNMKKVEKNCPEKNCSGFITQKNGKIYCTK